MQPIYALQSRRAFLIAASAGVGAMVAACRDSSGPAFNEELYARLRSRPVTPTESTTPGVHELGLYPDGRDGFFYVPRNYDAEVAAPLLVLLHGGGASDAEWRNVHVFGLMDELGIVLLAPESGGRTWDFPQTNYYGPDVTFIDQALGVVFQHCHIRADAITLGGFSDGATEALGLGVINGDFFSSVLAFSPGGFQVPLFRGKPRIFVSHGTSDPVLDYSWTRDFIVPELKRMGLTVEFVEFDGGHTLSKAVFDPAIRGFAAPA